MKKIMLISIMIGVQVMAFNLQQSEAAKAAFLFDAHLGYLIWDEWGGSDEFCLGVGFGAHFNRKMDLLLDVFYYEDETRKDIIGDITFRYVFLRERFWGPYMGVALSVLYDDPDIADLDTEIGVGLKPVFGIEIGRKKLVSFIEFGYRAGLSSYDDWETDWRNAPISFGIRYKR